MGAVAFMLMLLWTNRCQPPSSSVRRCRAACWVEMQKSKKADCTCSTQWHARLSHIDALQGPQLWRMTSTPTSGFQSIFATKQERKQGRGIDQCFAKCSIGNALQLVHVAIFANIGL